jgi:hypothetical protein
VFYNTISARQALCRPHHWSRRRLSTLALVPTSFHDYFGDVDIPDVVSGTNLLSLPATNMHYIDLHRRCQTGSSTTINAKRPTWYNVDTYVVWCGLCNSTTRPCRIQTLNVLRPIDVARMARSRRANHSSLGAGLEHHQVRAQ